MRISAPEEYPIKIEKMCGRTGRHSACKIKKKGQTGGGKGSNLKNQVMPSGSKLGSKQATSNKETKYRSII